MKLYADIDIHYIHYLIPPEKQNSYDLEDMDKHDNTGGFEVSDEWYSNWLRVRNEFFNLENEIVDKLREAKYGRTTEG